MNVWKLWFLVAVAVWAATLGFVLWSHHDVLNFGVAWSNEHLFARAPPAEMQLFQQAVRHRPVLEPSLLRDPPAPAIRPPASPSGATASAAAAAAASRNAARSGQGAPDAAAGRTHSAASSRPSHTAHQREPLAAAAAAAERNAEPRSSASSASMAGGRASHAASLRSVAASGCHRVLGGCTQCLEHYDGRPDFAGEDCVPVVPASALDNTCEPQRWVEEQSLIVDNSCGADGGSGSGVSSGSSGSVDNTGSASDGARDSGGGGGGGAKADAPRSYLATLTGAQFPLQHDAAAAGARLSAKAKTMCRATYAHTLKTTTKLLPDGGTFVFTGDLDDLWLRDSAAQVHPYLNSVSTDPEMRRLAEGLVKRHAFYVLFDPYANAFRVDTSYKFSAKQKSIGRHDYISTWDYELDSGCYFLRLVYALWRAVPDSPAVADAQTHKAAATMLEVWQAEQRHEEDPPMVGVSESDDRRFKKIGRPYRMPLAWPPICKDCSALPRKGKGPPTTYTGMTWSAFRPSDDPCTYSYLVPANMFASVALRYVQELAQEVWHDSALALRAKTLQGQIDEGIRKHAVVEHPRHGKIYAYEVDGLGGVNLMDDANVPNLLSIPYLGWDYDPEIYANTRAFVLSKDNPTYHESRNGKIRGFGSPHMAKRIRDNVWPMAQLMQGLTSPTLDEKLEMVDMLTATDAGTGWMHESYDVNNPKKFTRAWFCWPDSLFAELVMSVAGTNKCPA